MDTKYGSYNGITQEYHVSIYMYVYMKYHYASLTYSTHIKTVLSIPVKSSLIIIMTLRHIHFWFHLIEECRDRAIYSYYTNCTMTQFNMYYILLAVWS